MFELRVLGATDLRRTDGTRVTSVLAQPKRFALLAYVLLAAPGSFVRRDTLLALFWPESDEARARTSLRKALHYLRHSLGHVIAGSGSDDVGVDTNLVECDAVHLRAFAGAGRLEEAVALYRGELLPGFHIDGVPGFEQWLEAERIALRRLAAESSATLAARAHAVGDAESAASWQRRAHEIAPDDEDILRRALLFLVADGQRSAAIELLAVHRRRLEEVGIDPDPHLAAIVARPSAVRTVELTSVHTDRTGAPAPEPHIPSAPIVPDIRRVTEVAPVNGGSVKAVRNSGVRWLVPAAVALAALLAIWFVLPRLESPASASGSSPLVAVGAIRDFTGEPDSIGRLIPDLLATNLARAPRLRIVSAARLHEIAGAAGEDVRRSSVIAAAARTARAHELIEGSLYRLPDDRLRLDLRRLRLSDGELLDTYRVTGSNPFELVDRATATLALDIGGVERSGLRVADVTTRSLVALRFYQEGLDAYFKSDAESARRLFDAALAEDSTFAMAAYFASRANSNNGPVRIRYLQLAERLSHRTTERERLLIRGTLAFNLNEPEHLAISDSLVTRYPDEPAGQLLYARSLMLMGRFAEALAPLRRAVELDSMTLHSNAGSCRACEALLVMGNAYRFMDSTRAAERVVRRAFDARAESYAFASSLAGVLQANGKYAESDERLRQAGEVSMSAEHVALGLIRNDVRRGDFEQADAAVRGFIENSARGLRSSGRWLLITSLRHQGRLEDALGIIAEERNDTRIGPDFPPFALLMEAMIRYEQGDYVRSAALYDSLVALVPGKRSEGSWSRNTVWNMTHAANSHAAAEHLDLLDRMADSARSIGARSGYGRDRRLHHHIRGLLAAGRGDYDTAVTQYRAALYSMSGGYSRTNVELARALIATGRPAEAADVLDAPLRNGVLDSMQLYATRTELHALLGEALLAAGQHKRAREHLDAALDALKNADASFAGDIAHLRALRAQTE